MEDVDGTRAMNSGDSGECNGSTNNRSTAYDSNDNGISSTAAITALTTQEVNIPPCKVYVSHLKGRTYDSNQINKKLFEIQQVHPNICI